MANHGEQMPELVTVPISIFELTTLYEKPEWQLLAADRVRVVQHLFDALKPWEPVIDDVEVLNTGRLSDQGISLKLPLKRVTFFFGPASCRFTRDDANWDDPGETVLLMNTAISALARSSSIKVALQKAAIALHIQPRSLPFIDILRPFAPAQLTSLEGEPVSMMAAVAKWDNRKVTIDGSSAIANGIYLNIERDFASTANYDEISHQLRNDKARIFEMLGVEEAQG